MGQLIERFEREATLLRGRSRITDVMELAHLESQRWKAFENEMRETANPWDKQALAGGFAGLEVTPPVARLATATINSSTVDVPFWPVATWTPIAANPQCPKAYRLCAFGIATTAATPGTVSIQARFGQVQTAPSIGVSTTAAATASETQTPWMIFGDLIIRAGGAPTTGLVVAMFNYQQGTATTGGSAILPALDQIFGTTTGAVSVVTDGSTAAGLWIGGLAVTSTTNTFITDGVIWSSWN